MTQIKIKLTGGIMPEKKSKYAACYDLFCPNDYIIKPGRQVIDLGFVMELPQGFHADVRPRSGYSVEGFECELRMYYQGFDTPTVDILRIDADVIFGTIDSDYRDSCGVILLSRDKNSWLDMPSFRYLGRHLERYEYVIPKGTRIAQMLIARDEETVLVETDELDMTDNRGGGFGHTGTK